MGAIVRVRPTNVPPSDGRARTGDLLVAAVPSGRHRTHTAKPDRVPTNAGSRTRPSRS
jgi:hypothetical protein